MIRIERPRGTRDLLPDEMERRRSVESIFRRVVDRWGYGEVKTPTFESLDLFTIKSGEGIIDEIYAFVDKGGRQMALRPELTAPVMRLYVESFQVSAKPCKLFYFDNCFRYERPQKARFREFWQFGVELIGSDQPEADVEVIALAVEILSSVGIEGELRVGNLDIIKSIIKGLSSVEQACIMRLIDKNDIVGLEDYLREIKAPDPLSENLLSLIDLKGRDALEEALKITGDLPELDRFSRTLELLDALEVEYIVDLGIARGLDYYTGMVFEIYSDKLGAENQICGGGSYRLAHLFGGRETPSTGFGIGFDRVMEICSPPLRKTTTLYLVSFDDTRTEAMKIAQKLRKHTRVHIDVMNRKFKDQLRHANTIGADFVLIVGKDELESGKLTLKEMRSGEQELLTLEEIIERVEE